jgi:hypothetical protein
MKITVEPNEGEHADSLEELAALVARAQAMVAASGAYTGDGEQPAVRARVRLAVSAKVKSIEVSW